MAWKKCVVLADTHAPYHSETCMALVYEYLRREKPGIVIWNGDIIDSYWASKYTKTNQRYQGAKQEYEDGKFFIEQLKEACGDAEIWFNEGNHEYRQIPYLALRANDIFEMALPALTIPVMYNLEKLGVKYNPTKNGKSAWLQYVKHLYIAHGSYTGNNAARRMLDEVGDCVIFDHAHKYSLWAPTYGSGVQRFAIGGGCLCLPASFKEWDTWSRGFLTLEINKETGQFTPPAENRIVHMTELYSPDGKMQAYKHKDGSWKTREI